MRRCVLTPVDGFNEARRSWRFNISCILFGQSDEAVVEFLVKIDTLRNGAGTTPVPFLVLLVNRAALERLLSTVPLPPCRLPPDGSDLPPLSTPSRRVPAFPQQSIFWKRSVKKRDWGPRLHSRQFLGNRQWVILRPESRKTFKGMPLPRLPLKQGQRRRDQGHWKYAGGTERSG